MDLEMETRQSIVHSLRREPGERKERKTDLNYQRGKSSYIGQQYNKISKT